MIKTALTLASKGLHVFPCQPYQKIPATPRGCRDATADPDALKSWWQIRPGANVAVATGAASGIFVLDVDGFDGENMLRRLEAEHGALPATVEVITPGGPGRHLWFKHPGGTIRNSASKIGANLDVRGDGGYVLAPPSIHPSGEPYVWSVDSANAIADAPAWLLAAVAAPATRGNGNGNGNGAALPLTSSSDWQASITEIAEGRRDTTLTSVAGHLLRRFADPLLTRELLLALNVARCVPPLPEADVLRIINSVAGLELKRRGHGGG